MAGIYLHIPFCRQACSYCNFHFSTVMKSYDEVIEAMLAEIEMQQADWDENQPIESIYFGGGTPSLLKISDLENFMSKIKKFFPVKEHTEVTLEANPEDVTGEIAISWKKLGINRISIGIQSFYEEDLALMNRIHRPQKAKDAIQMIRNAGIENITGDLIYGVPGRNIQDWESNLKNLMTLRLPHFSSYALTIEPKTLLAWQVEKGKVKLPEQEEVAEQFHLLRQIATENGYKHYELSGFAWPGWHSRHNYSYWEGKSYLGIGPGAHSFDGKSRRWNIANNHKYVKALKNNNLAFDEEWLAEQDIFNELVMTRLRTSKGLQYEEISDKFGDEFVRHFNEQAKKLFENGDLAEKDHRIVIPSAKLFVSDDIIASLFYTE